MWQEMHVGADRRLVAMFRQHLSDAGIAGSTPLAEANTSRSTQLCYTPPFERRVRQHSFEANHDVAGPAHSERLGPLFAVRQTGNQNADELLLHGPHDLWVGERSWLGPRQTRGPGMYMQQMLSILNGRSQDLAAIRRCQYATGHCLAESG